MQKSKPGTCRSTATGIVTRNRSGPDARVDNGGIRMRIAGNAARIIGTYLRRAHSPPSHPPLRRRQFRKNWFQPPIHSIGAWGRGGTGVGEGERRRGRGWFAEARRRTIADCPGQAPGCDRRQRRCGQRNLSRGGARLTSLRSGSTEPHGRWRQKKRTPASQQTRIMRIRHRETLCS